MNVADRFRSYDASRYYEERVRELGSNSASEGFGLLFDYIHDPARGDRDLDALFGPMRLLMGRCQDIQSVRRDERRQRDKGRNGASETDAECLRGAVSPSAAKISFPEDSRNTLSDALKRIAYLRPAGDIDTAKNARGLLEQIEQIAINALVSEQVA